MGWFDEQMKQRIKADDDAFSDAFADLAGVVMGKSIKRAFLNDRIKTKSAIDEILKFYRVKRTELPDELSDLNDQMEYLLRPSGVMRRVVNLEGDWYQDAVGAYLGVLKTGTVVALLPNKTSGYTFINYETGETVKLNSRTAALLEVEAICFYKPLPLKKIDAKEFMLYLVKLASPLDYATIGVATLVVTLIGMLMPKLNKIIFSNIIKSGDMQLFFAVTAMLVASGVAKALIGTVKDILLRRLEMKSNAALQATLMMRLLSLPVDFFKKYSSGSLSSRIQSARELCAMFYSTIITSGFTALFSLAYIAQVFQYAPALVVPALTITFTTCLLTFLTAFVEMKQSQKIMEASAKEGGMVYSLIGSVQKLKLSGAEKRAFSRWAAVYREKAELTYDLPMFLSLKHVIATGISLAGTIVIYYMAVECNVDVSDYFAFSIAYGMVSGAFLSLSNVASTMAKIKPILEMLKPLLQTVPEVAVGKKVLTNITGGIELNNVSFRYSGSMPLIVDDLSLKIHPGQYVALVGKTGCGKSTLMRLLLGFETPQKGGIYYGDEDIANIDLKSLRRHIGVVMQNSKIFSSNIFSNITISAPWMTMEEAWEAAELAGIAEDIRSMPMGMNTLITEGSGGISGGQRQRMMIARAVAGNPRVLMFDEATSALDNLTQKIVRESLAKLKCTRIVIAHRLSTIKKCDCVFVLDKGRIVESGTYEELIQRNGYFAELVARQRLEN